MTKSKTPVQICKGFSMVKNKPCVRAAKENGYCVNHGGIETCMAINSLSDKRCSRPPIKETQYCAIHTKTDISTLDINSPICQGKFAHGEPCPRPSAYNGMCGYHSKYLKATDLNIPYSLDQCAHSQTCKNHK